MKITLLKQFVRLLALLPLSFSRGLGKLLGSTCWLFQNRMARTTRRNLALCFPALDQSALETLGRESLSHTMQTAMESGAVWLWPAQKSLALIEQVDGLELLQEAVKSKQGVLVLAPHLGNWELFGLFLNNCGCGQSWQLYQPPASPELDRFVLQARSRGGARMVATDNKGVAELLKALRRGEIVGILPDQIPPAAGGEYAPFFAVPALTMTLFNRLQEKTGARVLTGVAFRTDGGFRILLCEPEQEIYAKHMPTALKALNESIEQVIKISPAQYQWEYKRFRKQPGGGVSPYTQ